MKRKIINQKKFIKTTSIILVTVFLLLLIFLSNVEAKGSVKYKVESIISGDTLWSIAENEIENNDYYQNKDIRNVIEEIRSINNLESSNLTEGMKIKIPSY